MRLRAALERLTHTAVRTNIRAQGKKKFASFHWLESWTETIDEATGEPTGMTITLPDWLYRGVVERGGVLTIHEDYFLLTGGIERWLYRVVRKHAGSQEDRMGLHDEATPREIGLRRPAVRLRDRHPPGCPGKRIAGIRAFACS